MDESTLQSLRAALDASPENVEVRWLLLGACLDRDEAEEALRLFQGWTGSLQDLDLTKRRLAGRACLGAGAAEEALGILEEDDPESAILRARAYAQLDRQDEGREAYRRAVAANAALEDVDLEAELSANVRVFPTRVGGGEGERPKLKVYSNDDTDDSELHRLLMPEEESVDFSLVGGLEGVKKQIRKRIILPFQKPSLFQRFKKRVGGGILLYGPPGCGKTLLARATAGEVDAQFFNVAIADVLDMYIGESEAKLHAIFEKARADTPSVLFFDEIEALGGKRQYTRESTSSKLVSQFLAEMDGFSRNNSGVLILGATNVPWAVDPAFRRPGRFDRLMFVPPPDRPARKAILEILVQDRPTVGDLDLHGLAGRTSGFSGADLKNLVETGVDEAIEESLESGSECPMTAEHLRQALGEVRSTTLEWLTTARNYARYANEGGQYDEVLEFLKRHGK